ncbi:MAG: homoserine kinase [Bacteroidota bacterium]
MPNSITVFSPATVANVACGFDILGLALDLPGDTITLHRSDAPGIRITRITGAEGLPTDPAQNVCGVAIQALLDALGSTQGFELELEKGIPPGSGIGSSAASAAGAVFAANELLGGPFRRADLVPFAMEGEKLVSGVAHADNVAPALLGGFVLVRSYAPLDLVPIATPERLCCAVIHPHIEVKTADARRILRRDISLAAAIRQWGNVGGLVAGLLTNDLDLVGRSLEDVVVEPVRSILIPGYEEVKTAALASGALGCSISGSGPSIFALCDGIESARHVRDIIAQTYRELGLEFKVYASPVNRAGVRIVEP